MTYDFGIERFADAFADLEPLMRRQYGEMKARLEGEGHTVSDFNPDVASYSDYNDRGLLFLFTVRKDGEPVGYAMTYVLRDMHNQDMIALDDTIYIHPDHRNGIGRKLAGRVLKALGDAGVKRVVVSATTDPRAANMWRRMGFRDTAVQMTYHFEDN